MEQVKWTTPSGANVTAKIVRECVNLADHNFTSACHEFEVSVEGIGEFQVTLDGAIFKSNMLVYVPSVKNRVIVYIQATPEAAALYAAYRAESKARLGRSLAADMKHESNRPGYCHKCHSFCYGDCEAN